MSGRIHLDFTNISVVLQCDDCPWWHGFAFDRIEAWTVARRHEEQHHPGARQADAALRHAVKRSTLSGG